MHRNNEYNAQLAGKINVFRRPSTRGPYKNYTVFSPLNINFVSNGNDEYLTYWEHWMPIKCSELRTPAAMVT